MFTSNWIGAVLRGLQSIFNTNQRIEFEPGQILRGEIIRAFPNQMVQVKIGGAVIHAQLNAPLEVGQQAWLQVLPQSNPVTLKVIDKPSRSSGQDYSDPTKNERQSVEQLLRAMGIKVDRSNIQNLTTLIQNKIALKSSDLSPMLDLMRQLPSTERIVQLFQFAQQRSIPITKENFLSLDSAIFGKPLVHVLEQLIQVQHHDPQISQLIQQLNRSWQQAKSTMNSILQPNQPIMAETMQTSELTLQEHAKVTTQGIDRGRIDHLQRLEHDLLQEQQIPSNSREVKQYAVTNMFKDALPKEQSLLKFFKIIGLDYESSQLKNFPHIQTTSPILSEGLRQIKGILIELSQLETLPTQIKEVVDHGIRSITGQQLLLMQEQQSPWQSVILQIALPNQLKDSHPSFVHIQGRKGRSEGIDIENCRLFFHLELQALDTTMIDIHITSRKMNIVLYNDHEWVKALVEEHKEEWKQALEPLTYQVLQLKVLPTSQFSSPKANTASYSIPSSYQGVDIRI